MNASADPVANTHTPVDAPSPTEAWLAEHPADAAFDENAALAKATLPLPLDLGEEEEIEDAVGDEADDEGEVENEPVEAEATPAAKPEGEAPVVEAEAKPAKAKPAEPQPKTFAPDEKIGLAEGIEWTRQQVVDALQERVQLQGRVAEIGTFEKVFRMNAEQAQQVWGPVIEQIVAKPALAQFIQGYMENPAKQAYLDQCATYFDESNPQAAAPTMPATAPVVALPPETQRQLDELRTWQADKQKQEAVDRFNREVEAVRARYPFVVEDASLFNDLRETARMMWQQDNKKGLLDALQLKSGLYEALAAARTAQEQPPAQAASVPVPTLPSPGASPSTKRTPKRRREFADLDEATQAWLAEHPGDYQE